MKSLVVVLFVLPLIWAALAGTFRFIGRAGQQDLFMGMLGYGTSKEESDAFVAKSLGQERAIGAFGNALWRGWPLALASLGVGIWLLLSG